MLITANQITKYHNDKCIFKDISFSIEENEKIAVIGINGTGKSTLLKILAGMEDYQGPTLLRKRDLRIAYLPQNPIFNENLSILEEMHIKINDNKVEDFEIKSVLGKLEIYNVNDKIKLLKIIDYTNIDKPSLELIIRTHHNNKIKITFQSTPYTIKAIEFIENDWLELLNTKRTSKIKKN